MSEPLLPLRLPVSVMSEGQRLYAYYLLLYGAYAGLPEEITKDLRVELRCLYPQWHKTSPQKMADICYFPITKAGLLDAGRYVKLNRDSYDIYNSIHPRIGEAKVGADKRQVLPESRYYHCLPIDLDAKPPFGGPTAADAHFAKAQERGLNAPHMVVSGRNGYHLYYFLSEFVDGNGEEGSSSYENLCKRLYKLVNGPPTGYDDKGKGIWNCPTADTNIGKLKSTLRPPGSYNHGKKQTDGLHEVTLTVYRPEAPKYSFDEWVDGEGSGTTLPYLERSVSSTLPEEFQRRQRLEADGLSPYERRRIPRRTHDFLAEGPDGDKGLHHKKILTACTDLAWAGYTQEEALQLLQQYLLREQSDNHKYRLMIYESPGRSFIWNDTPCPQLPEITVW